MSIEDDVTKINEVTARLAGPMKVWVLRNDSEKAGDCVWLFATEAKARERWAEIVNEDCDRYNKSEEERQQYMDEIFTRCENSLEIPELEWYWLEEQEVEA